MISLGIPNTCTVYTSLILFGLLEYHLMFMTLTTKIKSWLLSISNKAIGIIKLVKLSQNVIVGILTWTQNITLAWLHLCNKAIQNPSFMVTEFV